MYCFQNNKIYMFKIPGNFDVHLSINSIKKKQLRPDELMWRKLSIWKPVDAKLGQEIIQKVWIIHSLSSIYKGLTYLKIWFKVNIINTTLVWGSCSTVQLLIQLSPGKLGWRLYLVLLNSKSAVISVFRTRIFNLPILNDCSILNPEESWSWSTCIQHATNIFWLLTMSLWPGPRI